MKIRLPEGTALIIPPQKRDYESEKADEEKAKGKEGATTTTTTTTTTTKKKHWIICLFTSRQFGKNVSPPDTILANTELAIAEMKEQLARLAVRNINEDEGNGSGMSAPRELWSCRFNSGLFRVEWSRSRRVMEEAGLEVTVVRPVGDKL